MSTKQQDKPRDEEKQGPRSHDVAIGNRVLHALGQPGNLVRVQVRQVWGAHYRVNIFVGNDAASAKVAHSYFLTTDNDGIIIAATPKIVKQY
jgi:hypothetical protein